MGQRTRTAPGPAGRVRIDLRDLKPTTVDAGHAVAEFTQDFASPGYRDEVNKRLD